MITKNMVLLKGMLTVVQQPGIPALPTQKIGL